MKYVVMCEFLGDIHCEEYETAENAIIAADSYFDHLTNSEIKKSRFMCVLESINPDPEAENHFDGNQIAVYIGNDIWTADRQTGTLIDQFHDIRSAKEAIDEYESEDMENGCFEWDFYDIVNSNHMSLTRRN